MINNFGPAKEKKKSSFIMVDLTLAYCICNVVMEHIFYGLIGFEILKNLLEMQQFKMPYFKNSEIWKFSSLTKNFKI